MDLLVGKRVGSYRLVRSLGAGGMGSVYLGEHVVTGAKMAVKVLHRHHLGDRSVERRFINEARLTNVVANPGIVRIFDCGRSKELGVYLLMEYLEGQTLLDRWQASRGRLALGDAARILLQVAATMAAAHDRGFVHRDLKLSNIFLVRDASVVGGERAKVLDFGVAKILFASLATMTGQLLGTRAYMAPEQLLDAKQVDHRADVYSLGVIAYALLSGESPFTTEQLEQMLRDRRPPLPVPLRERCPDLPEAVERVVMQTMAADLQERFASMSVFAEALQRALLASAGRRSDEPVTRVFVDALGEPSTEVSSRPARAFEAAGDTVDVQATEMALIARKPPRRHWPWWAWALLAIPAVALVRGLVLLGGLATHQRAATTVDDATLPPRPRRDAAPASVSIAEERGLPAPDSAPDRGAEHPTRRKPPRRPPAAKKRPTVEKKAPPAPVPKKQSPPPPKKKSDPARPGDGTDELKR
jgi:serine/threonine protein kinase